MGKTSAYTLRMDERMDTVLESLRKSMALSTKADVLRMGVGVLRELQRRQQAEGKGVDVALGITKNDELVQRLVLVG